MSDAYEALAYIYSEKESSESKGMGSIPGLELNIKKWERQRWEDTPAFHYTHINLLEALLRCHYNKFTVNSRKYRRRNNKDFKYENLVGVLAFSVRLALSERQASKTVPFSLKWKKKGKQDNNFNRKFVDQKLCHLLRSMCDDYDEFEKLRPLLMDLKASPLLEGEDPELVDKFIDYVLGVNLTPALAERHRRRYIEGL